MRALLDTNVIVSALFWRGHSHRLWLLVRAGAIKAVTSSELLAELRDVLTREEGLFRLSRSELRRIRSQIRRHTILVRPRSKIGILRDEADNRVLERAVKGGVEMVVTGDRALLRLRRYRDIADLTPAQAFHIASDLPRPIRRGRRT